MSADPQDRPLYSSLDAYRDLISTLHAFVGIVLYEYLRSSDGLRERIIRNFIARGQTCLESVESLWTLGHFQDCSSLNRCLLDRLFYLHALGRDDDFERYDDWSFFEQFRCANYARSNTPFKLRSDIQEFTEEEKERYKQITSSGKPEWQRPDPESTAKDMGRDFLYQISYSRGSHHVHPMANDGQFDFERITGLGEGEPSDQRVLLNNSILFQLLIIRKGLNIGSPKWRRLIYDFLDNSLTFLQTGSSIYKATFIKIANQGPDCFWTDSNKTRT